MAKYKRNPVRKNILQDYAGIPRISRAELLEKINRLQGEHRIRNKALVSFLYLSGCRISEVCKFIKEKNLKRTKKARDERGRLLKEDIPAPINERRLVGQPIKKRDIVYKETSISIADVRCLKRRKLGTRTIPITYNERDIHFIELIETYLDTKEDSDPLFDMTRQNAYMIMQKVNLFCHWLRHIRMSHLVVDWQFRAHELQKFAGWTTIGVSDRYVHLDTTDLEKKMR